MIICLLSYLQRVNYNILKTFYSIKYYIKNRF
nr:MAG TPA: hypothetical protein [Caudoviricetes sp.]